ncbi:MAG: hypothetical protein AB7E79_12615 [Rhodospirillaceae bacterium]
MTARRQDKSAVCDRPAGGAERPQPAVSPARSIHRASDPACDIGRCDLCGELYNLRHSYEVLHHLHGRRFDEVLH